MDGTVRVTVTAACVRGCALAYVQHKEADGWWALYEQEQHQADSPFHTRGLPKGQSRCCN
ncbi:hypothetical protein V8C40DRAFT_237412 [Trichoderma camerunense]